MLSVPLALGSWRRTRDILLTRHASLPSSLLAEIKASVQYVPERFLLRMISLMWGKKQLVWKFRESSSHPSLVSIQWKAPFFFNCRNATAVVKLLSFCIMNTWQEQMRQHFMVEHPFCDFPTPFFLVGCIYWAAPNVLVLSAPIMHSHLLLLTKHYN